MAKSEKGASPRGSSRDDLGLGVREETDGPEIEKKSRNRPRTLESA